LKQPLCAALAEADRSRIAEYRAEQEARIRSYMAAQTASASAVAVKIEAVSIDIFHSELAQTPRLLLERFNDSCAPRAQFLVSRVDVRRKDPVNRRFEWAASSAKENRDVIARDGADIASWI